MNLMDDEIEEIRARKKRHLLERMLGKKEETPTAQPSQASQAPSEPVQLDDATLENAVRTYPFLVVDCWAPWCAPCRMIAPAVEQLAKKYQGKIVFGKLNVDYNQRSAAKYQIMSIPALLVFRNGRHADTIIGAMPAGPLEQRLKRYF